MKTNTYRGHTIKLQKDCWGSETYFVYDNEGNQLRECFDFHCEALEAINEHIHS